MKVILLAALLGFIAAQPPDESNLPDSEKRMPPGWHCKRPDVTISKGEHAVHCPCTYSCTIDEEGNVTEHESSTCMGWCEKNGRKCTCWPEGDPQHPCTKVEGGPNARMDMNGHVVAVATHHHE